MATILGLGLISFGLLIDGVNVYWYLMSRRRKTPSPIVLVPAVLYLVGSVDLGWSRIGWLLGMALFILLFLVHVCAILGLPGVLRGRQNRKQVRPFFEWTALSDDANEGGTKG